jgi:hypothetical protein
MTRTVHKMPTDRVRAIQDRRRSAAAMPQDRRDRRARTRGASKSRAIAEQVAR